MSDNQLVVRSNSALMPAMGIQDAIARYNAVVDFTKQVMKEGKDFGTIPGAGTKPTLLKPGAEKLCSLFGLAPKFSPLDHTVDFEKGLFYLQYECNLYRDGVMVGSGIGSCNSMEKKYRYRQGERTCPSCGKPTIIKGKQEYGGGFICFAKKGGCGAKFGDNDPAIVKQDIGQVENPDRADLLNTIDKMAQKRALVAAVLITTNASEFFTQDIEDMTFIEGQFIDVTPSPVQAPTHAAEIVTELGYTEQPPAKPVNMSAPIKVDYKGKAAEWLVAEHLAENIHSAISIVAHFGEVTADNRDAFKAWARNYRAWRDAGAEVKAAVENAHAGTNPNA